MKSIDRTITPAEVAVRGLAAGFAATALMSAISRIPGIRQQIERTRPAERAIASTELASGVAPMSPAMALVQASGPGPEGPAGLFAAKVASGLFGRDLGKETERWGRVVHFAYGSIWGIVYGIAQTPRRRDPFVAGASYGLGVWAAGPGLLVPAMKLMPAPSKASRMQTALILAAHVVYGVTLAAIFDRLMHTPSHGRV